MNSKNSSLLAITIATLFVVGSMVAIVATDDVDARKKRGGNSQSVNVGNGGNGSGNGGDDNGRGGDGRGGGGGNGELTVAMAAATATATEVAVVAATAMSVTVHLAELVEAQLPGSGQADMEVGGSGGSNNGNGGSNNGNGGNENCDNTGGGTKLQQRQGVGVHNRS